MSHQLIDLNPDLKRLREDRYDIKIVDGDLMVGNVPYLNAAKQVKRGTLRSKLNLSADILGRPDPHTVKFDGECCPCNQHGQPMLTLLPGRNEKDFATFSRKPPPPNDHYDNYYDQIKTYIMFLLTPIHTIDPSVTAQWPTVVEATKVESIFVYEETASSRAGISEVTKKLAQHRVVIIGVGGTGSYILDQIAKTPVKQIDIYDADTLLNHNAFRAPGAPSIEELRAYPKKVVYFAAQYSKMHRGIKAHEERIEASNVEQLKGTDFVFLSMDSGEQKRLIVSKLEEFGIPFIDVGMGVKLINGSLAGTLRVTVSTNKKRDHVVKMNRISYADANDEKNDYGENIQTADLNALNAILAVIKWKKLLGFYADLKQEFNNTFFIETNKLLNEDHCEEAIQ